MNTNKNSYTLIYMVVIIIIVSLLLSITSGVLKNRQNENVKLDKKKQILSSLPAVDFSQDAAKTYEATIKEFNMLDAEGNVSKKLNPVNDFDYVPAETEFPVYVADVKGQVKYIIPMKGAGLWGAIWGYIALNDDRSTVYGIYFNHASETPGLGAEIVTPHFREPFIGKHILNADGKFASIAVMKAGQTAKGQDQVDAISGGTITSKGVETMLSNCLGNYEKFFTASKEAESEADSTMVKPVIDGDK